MSDIKPTQGATLASTGENAPSTQAQNPPSQPQGDESLADLASKPPTRHPEPSSSLHGAAHEQSLVADGKLPGLEKASGEEEARERKPGEEDAAGNKIHHKGVLGHILHWEHSGMNADE